MPDDAIDDTALIAHWMRWGVALVGDEDVSWAAVVWRRGDDSPPITVAAQDGFPSREAAVGFACDALRGDGARVMVIGGNVRLEDLLEFETVATGLA